MRHKAIITLGVVLLVTAAVAAQENRSEISLQGTGFFTKDSSGNGTLQRGTETGGFLVGYRYHFNRWLAAEAVYGYDRNTQEYFAPAGVSRIQANVHQATGGLAFNLVRPNEQQLRGCAGCSTANYWRVLVRRRCGLPNCQTRLPASGVSWPCVQHTRLRVQEPEHEHCYTHSATISRYCVPILS